MRNDTRPVLLASALPACDVEVRPGERPSIVCPVCHTWRLVREGRIFPHPGPDGRRCAESARRFALDLPLARLERDQRAAVAHAAQRRGNRVHRKPAPPVAPPVFRLTIR
jgi:hypothetical protein